MQASFVFVDSVLSDWTVPTNIANTVEIHNIDLLNCELVANHNLTQFKTLFQRVNTEKNQLIKIQHYWLLSKATRDAYVLIELITYPCPTLT